MDKAISLIIPGLAHEIQKLFQPENIIKILAPVFVAFAVNNILQRLLRVPKKLENPRTKTYLSLARSVVTTVIYFIAIYFIFILLGINVTPLFASAGIIGIIVGLGVRSIMEDFFNGFFILSQDTVSVGDYISVGTSEGIVEDIGLRSIRLRNRNGSVHIVPNREIKIIVNYSRRPSRIEIDIPFKSKQRIDSIYDILNAAIIKIRKDKSVGQAISSGSILGVEDVSAGKINIKVLLVVKAGLRENIARLFRYIVIKETEKSKISLAE